MENNQALNIPGVSEELTAPHSKESTAKGDDPVMRKVEFEDIEAQIDMGRLLEFEAQIGCPLPPAYCQFLIQTNGGRPATCNYSISVGGRPEFNPEIGSLDVDLFYSVNDEKYPDIGLSEVYARLDSRIPSASSLPPSTADNPGGVMTRETFARASSPSLFEPV